MTNSVGDVLKHSRLGRGEWVVTATKMSGGGYAQGGDYYSDAHTLILRPIGNLTIDNKATPKKFYQNTGSFIDEVVLPYIEPTRKVRVVLHAEEIK